MFDYKELKMISEEELNFLIQKAEEEISRRAEAKLEEAKAKTVIAIRELIALCREAKLYHLGKVYWECPDCDEGQYFDILSEDVLKDVADILEG